MAIEKVREYLSRYGVADRIMEFEMSSATVELAANALRCEPERIAKTLSFLAGDESILIVAAGDAKVDNHKYKMKFGVKAKMLPPEEVEEKIGHVIGGVCPFGIKKRVKVYLDDSLHRFDVVYPACGSENSAIGLTIKELEEYSCYTEWIDVCKNWNMTEKRERS